MSPRPIISDAFVVKSALEDPAFPGVARLTAGGETREHKLRDFAVTVNTALFPVPTSNSNSSSSSKAAASPSAIAFTIFAADDILALNEKERENFFAGIKATYAMTGVVMEVRFPPGAEGQLSSGICSVVVSFGGLLCSFSGSEKTLDGVLKVDDAVVIALKR